MKSHWRMIFWTHLWRLWETANHWKIVMSRHSGNLSRLRITLYLYSINSSVLVTVYSITSKILLIKRLSTCTQRRPPFDARWWCARQRLKSLWQREIARKEQRSVKHVALKGIIRCTATSSLEFSVTINLSATWDVEQVLNPLRFKQQPSSRTSTHNHTRQRAAH